MEAWERVHERNEAERAARAEINRRMDAYLLSLDEDDEADVWQERYERLEARVASLERRIAELEAAEVKRKSKK